MWGPREDGRSLVVQEVEAAIGDLDSLVDYLEDLSARPSESELEPEEVALCEVVSGWAGRLAPEKVPPVFQGRFSGLSDRPPRGVAIPYSPTPERVSA